MLNELFLVFLLEVILERSGFILVFLDLGLAQSGPNLDSLLRSLKVGLVDNSYACDLFKFWNSAGDKVCDYLFPEFVYEIQLSGEESDGKVTAFGVGLIFPGW